MMLYKKQWHFFPSPIDGTVCLFTLSRLSCSLQSQLSESGRAGPAFRGPVPLNGSLPRHAPLLPLSKPRDLPSHLGLSQSSLASTTSGSNSPHPSRAPLDREKDRDGLGAIRRGSFVERCQERAKCSDLSSMDAGRRSLAVCSELEARLGLRMQSSFSALPTPSSASSMRRPSPATPSPTPSPVSPTRSQTPVSPRRPPLTSPTSETPPSENGTGHESPASPPTTSPKPHMNETSFWGPWEECLRVVKQTVVPYNIECEVFKRYVNDSNIPWDFSKKDGERYWNKCFALCTFTNTL